MENDFRIWKFPLAIGNSSVVLMPEDSKMLSVGNQNGVLCLWAVCEIEKKYVPHKFTVVGTGRLMPKQLGNFLGTAIVPPNVWHVYQDIR